MLTIVPTSRRRFLKVASGAAALGTLALGADATLLEPNHPRLVRVEIPLRRLPAEFDGLKIVQLSDLHYDPYFSAGPIAAAVRMTNVLAPDLVVVTGDFVSLSALGARKLSVRAAHRSEPCAQLLLALRARYGIWAVLGNHDAFSDGPYIETTLRRVGIHVLSNEAIPLERDGQQIWLAGVGDVLAGEANLDDALRGIPSGGPVILLAHEPDFADKVARFPVDLQLSGHSHGGQVRFPFLGAVYLPELGRKYPWGLHRIEQLTLYTNIGLGTLRIPVRWNCPPE
jgi:uncharacterized protein